MLRPSWRHSFLRHIDTLGCPPTGRSRFSKLGFSRWLFPRSLIFGIRPHAARRPLSAGPYRRGCVGLLQWGTGHTAYAFDTKTASGPLGTFSGGFLAGISLFPRTPRFVTAFRSAMLWFGSVVAVVATVQTFTSPGKIFWLFPTSTPIT